MTNHPIIPASIFELSAFEEQSWQSKLDALRLSGVPLNASAPMISDQWAALLTPGLRKTFVQRQHPRAELFKRTSIFPTDTSQRAYEEYQGVGDMSADAWNEFERTGRTPYDVPEIGFKLRLEHREFTKGMSVRKKLMDDNLYPGAPIPKSVTQDAILLKDSGELFREKSAADLFNNAFTDSGVDAAGYTMTGADGVGLVSANHPLSPSNAAVQSNKLALALTGANLVTAKNMMRSFTDSVGELSAAHPDTLLVPPELEETARVIVESQAIPGSDFNDINVNRGRYNIVVWDYLTNPDAWFLIDTTLKSEHLIWLDRIMLQLMPGELDVKSTFIATWTAYQRFSRGWDSPFWILGSDPTP